MARCHDAGRCLIDGSTRTVQDCTRHPATAAARTPLPRMSRTDPAPVARTAAWERSLTARACAARVQTDKSPDTLMAPFRPLPAALEGYRPRSPEPQETPRRPTSTLRPMPSREGQDAGAWDAPRGCPWHLRRRASPSSGLRLEWLPFAIHLPPSRLSAFGAAEKNSEELGNGRIVSRCTPGRTRARTLARLPQVWVGRPGPSGSLRRCRALTRMCRREAG